MALSVTINGTDRATLLMDKSLSITQVRDVFAGRCDFTLRNLIPAMSQTVVIADGATTYFDGTVRGLAVTEVKPGAYFCRVTAHDTVTPPADSIGPFALSDQSGEATYQDLMSGQLTSFGNFGSPAVYAPYEWWRLGEASGTTAEGEKGVQDGTYVDTPTLGVTGALDNANTAITLNGSSEHVTCGSAKLAGQADFSIACWVKTSNKAASQVMYGESEAGATNPLVLFYLSTSGRPALQYRDNAGTNNTIAATSGDWADGTWHQFALTKSGTAITIYADGAEVGSGTLTATNTLSGTILAWIGAQPTGAYHLNGSIDEVMIWRSVVDVVMVRQLYAMRDIRPYTSLTADCVYDGTTYVTGATASTLSAGLATGQLITLTSDNFGLHGLEVQVQELAIRWLNATTPVYTAKLGDAPIHLASAFP